MWRRLRTNLEGIRAPIRTFNIGYGCEDSKSFLMKI